MKCPISNNNICKWSNYIIFALFFILTIGIFFTHTNHSLFLSINSFHNFVPVVIWKFLNLVSYSKFFILPILLLIITFIWRKYKIPNIILLIIVYFAVFILLKNIFGEARPYIVLNPKTFYWLNSFENAHKSAYRSYPSGHVGNMAIFAFALSAMFFQNKYFLQFLMFLLVILVGVARICTGWHWPIDVLTSGLIGYILVKICLYIKFKDKNKNSL